MAGAGLPALAPEVPSPFPPLRLAAGETQEIALTLPDNLTAWRVEAVAFAPSGHAERQLLRFGLRQEHILRLGLELPVSRVIVNQAHCFATGGAFDNGLPFSLSMGCGTWGGNNFSDNMSYRQYMNTTRIARKIPPRMPTEAEIFGDYLAKHGV